MGVSATEAPPRRGCEVTMRRYPIAWAWRFTDGSLGMWARPTIDDLLNESRPDPDAEPVRVRLVPVRDYAALRRLAGGRK